MQHHLHDICDYTAGVTAAQAEWDNPVERTRAVKSGEAMVAQSRADLAANASESAVEAAKVKELEDQYRRESLAAEVSAFPELQRAQTGLKLETQRATYALSKARRYSLEAKLQQQEADLAAAKENLRLRIQGDADAR